MYLKFDIINGKLIARLVGELDHHTAREVRVKIDDMIEREEASKVILDFNGVSFMDSSGIGVVVGRYKKVKGKGGKLCVANITKSVNRVFELSGLFKIVEKFDSVESAIEKF